jgi:hypothetical protein
MGGAHVSAPFSRWAARRTRTWAARVNVAQHEFLFLFFLFCFLFLISKIQIWIQFQLWTYTHFKCSNLIYYYGKGFLCSWIYFSILCSSFYPLPSNIRISFRIQILIQRLTYFFLHYLYIVTKCKQKGNLSMMHDFLECLLLIIYLCKWGVHMKW